MNDLSVKEAIKMLEEMGLVEDSGITRHGEVVWKLSEKGRDPLYAGQVLSAFEGLEEIEEAGDFSN